MHLQLSKSCLNTKEDAINLHRILKGKIEIHNRVSVENAFDEATIKNWYMIIHQSGTTLL